MDKEDRFRQSTWLEFLYQRFTLALDLLDENGVMLVSINDEQRALLELMLDEAMPGMKLGCFVWRTRKGGYDSGNFSKDHDFVLAYRKPKFEFHGTEKIAMTTPTQTKIVEGTGPMIHSSNQRPTNNGRTPSIS
ncbi:DNA methyltransferase [Pseudaestuariivita sp.]|uniref:DNA methyltransferase n=1 Tax=Pseudaestuariivita sp. TaxID=2211669 RepID=UPI00405854CF